MKSSRLHLPTWLKVLIVIVLASLSIVLLWRLVYNSELGTGDFIGYWSATYLVRQGLNPYSEELIGAVQKEVLQAGYRFPVMSWNPPTLFVVLLPLTWFSFQTAKTIWLMINLVLIKKE